MKKWDATRDIDIYFNYQAKQANKDYKKVNKMKNEIIINGVVVGVLSLEYIHIHDHGILTIESEFRLTDMFPDISHVQFSNKNKNKSIVRCMVIKEIYQKFVDGVEPYDVLYETQIIGE